LQESTKKAQQLSDELALVKAELEKSRNEVELLKEATGQSSQLPTDYAKLTEENKQLALELEWLESQLAAFEQETKQVVELLSSECLEFHPWLFISRMSFFSFVGF
jgi:hypothetical protein